MAGRGSAGVGAVVTITIMGLLVLGLFVATLVFYTQGNKTQQLLLEANAALEDYVREGERQQDRVRGYAAEAQAARKSVVMHLADSLEAANRIAVGSPRITTEVLTTRVNEIEGVRSSSLFGALQGRDQQITALNNQLTAANNARTQAQRDLASARASVTQIEAAFNTTMDAANERINAYGSDINNYTTSLQQVERLTSDQLMQLQSDYTAQITQINSDLAQVREENLILIEQLRALQRTSQVAGMVPDPATLVDGSVAAINPADREVTISIGRRQKVVLGMTFTVYGSTQQIKLDPATGNYTQGKATVEVIRISDATATCRILSERQGNPIVRGDVITNAVYDPNKVFRMVVYGNFDTNRDGSSTPRERDDLADLIREWGGTVVDDLAGDVDFLILGTRPIVPPSPAPGTDIAVMSEWQRLDRMARRYDELFNRARETSIPVLNQNRLFYLIGQ